MCCCCCHACCREQPLRIADAGDFDGMPLERALRILDGCMWALLAFAVALAVFAIVWSVKHS